MIPFLRTVAVATPIFGVMLAANPSAAQGQERTIVDKGPERHLLYKPDEVKWKDAPASLEPEAQVAVLEGNPSKPGVFTMRIKIPDGFVIASRTHPNVERVTVVSGTFLLGAGKEVDKEAATSMEAGSYTAMPPGMQHYAIADGGTVVHLTSVGPWQIDYVNPEDDPRRKD